MDSYRYVARDGDGEKREGMTQAVCTTDVVGWLREQGYTPISIDRISTEVRQTKPGLGLRRVRSADLAAVCWQLCTMIEGGITLTAAVETIAEDIENKYLQKVLRHVLAMMEKGESFSDSIAQFPNVFNQLSYAILLAGESGGNLALSLRRVAEYFDNRDKLARKVKGAIAYPIFVFAFVILVVTFIMAFIIPRFREILLQFGGKLPAFTQGFLTVYDVIYYNLLYIGAALLLLILLGIFLYNKTGSVHRLFSRIALRWPLIGKILRQAFIATFCRTTATLIEAGVPVLDVFDILSTMSRNDVISSAIVRTREYIVQGSSVALGMATAGFFPNLVIKMTQVGEESGSLSKVLDRTADYYERRVESTISTLLIMLEPALVVAVGAIVLIVVLALYLPVFSLSDIAG
ncbi:MAG TPA: type II secretion system F family protein [Sedimentisphaerales bacterium]|nr:type II secretion system F family protein [Sedimentisphaerales bacterium]